MPSEHALLCLTGRAASAATWNLLEAVSEDAPLGNLSVPPPAPSSPPCLFLSVKRTSIYVGGWYNKLDRSGTPHTAEPEQAAVVAALRFACLIS